MPDQQQIQDTILSASYQMALLVEANRLKLVGGTAPGNIDWTDATWFYLNINALQRQFNLADYTSDGTLAVYDCLNKKIGFDTTISNVDPNYQAPNTTIIISVAKPPIDITFSDFDPASQDPTTGGRIVYNNSDWKGLNPMLFITNPIVTALFRGTDYALLPTGGIQLLPGGNLPEIYDGTILRATGYENA